MKCRWKCCDNEIVGKRSDSTYCSNKCKNKGSVDRRRKLLKEKAIAYKGGACEICGYNKCIWALQFHHRDPAEKEFEVGSGNTYGWEKIKAETDKCRLLCANCHCEAHYKDHCSLA